LSVALTHPHAQGTKMILGYPSIPLRRPEVYATDVLAAVLGEGRSSRLYREVKDKMGLVEEISAFNYTPKYPGYFGVVATLSDGGKVEAARAAILKILEMSKNVPPSEDELQRAKK